MRSLEKAYLEGLIVYPRTESDYIPDSELLSYNPHPKLAVFNTFCEPLLKSEYTFNKSTMYLHFHNIRALAPSTYKKVKTKIDKIIQTVRNKDIENIVNSYFNFVERNRKKNLNYFIEEELEHFRTNYQKGIELKKYNTFNELIEENKKKDIFLQENNSNSQTIISLR